MSVKIKKVNLNKIKLSPSQKKKIKKHREDLTDIVTGKDDRFIIIMGPCSAWPKKATLEYASRLRELQDKVNDKIKIVMRVYTQKPRTALGWKGAFMQKDPCKGPALSASVKYVQDMILRILDLDLAMADEALFLPVTYYYEEALSYIAIGARSSEDQEHRSYASSLSFPVGLKNPSSGDLDVASNSVLSAQNESLFYIEGELRESDGNKYAHLVLRGGKRPNFYLKDVLSAVEIMEKKGVKNKSIIIDCNHANSGKNHIKQINVAKYVLKNIKDNEKYANHVKGLMVESFLKDGNQKIDCKGGIDMEGLSITDPSLGWDKSEELVMFLYKNL